MNAWGLGCAIFLVGGLVYVWRHRNDCNEEFWPAEYQLVPDAYTLADEDFAGATVVLSSGVEVVIPAGWSAADVDELLATAHDIDAWGATA